MIFDRIASSRDCGGSVEESLYDIVSGMPGLPLSVVSKFDLSQTAIVYTDDGLCKVYIFAVDGDGETHMIIQDKDTAAYVANMVVPELDVTSGLRCAEFVEDAPMAVSVSLS